VLVLMRAASVVATRQGGGPSGAIDAWLAGHLGPAERPLAAPLSAGEASRLDDVAELRARHLSVRGLHATG
jgi:hypothetical protein